MATTHWETVKKPAKKTKGPDVPLTKIDKKNFVANMPRIESAPPVKESTTIFEAFNEKERKAEERLRKQQEGSPVANGKKSSHTTHKRKPEKDRKANGPITIAQGIANIDVGEIETLLAKDQNTFPENPEVWLKDIASVLNLKMDKVPETDPVFEKHPHNFPLCEVPNKTQKVLMSTINGCSTKTLELFLEHCIHSMVMDITKGISTYGYRIYIQLLLFHRPNILQNNMNKYEEMLRANQNRPLRCLSIMWASGQVGTKSLSFGIKVWLDLMFPLIHTRAFSPYIVQYLQTLFKVHTEVKSSHSALSIGDFCRIMEQVYKPSSNFPTNLQKKMLLIYPTIKKVAFGPHPETHLRNFFQKFLSLLTRVKTPNYKQELLDCLVTCLCVDKHCFSEWRQCYTKNLTPSGILLQHMCNTWSDVGNRIDRNLCHETVRAFQVTNEEYNIKANGADRDGHKACVSACNDLLLKTGKMRFPWRSLLMLLLTLCGGVLIFDVYFHNGFKDSKTNQVLKETGILMFLTQVWNRVCLYSAKSQVWLQKNIPYYWAQTSAFLAPYMQKLWELLYDLGIYIVNVTQPARLWLNENVPKALEWVNAQLPWLYEYSVYYWNIVWMFVWNNSVWLWQHIVYYFNIASTWLLQNVFTGNLSPENIQKTLAIVLTTIQTYLMAFFQWCNNLVQSATQSSAQS